MTLAVLVVLLGGVGALIWTWAQTAPTVVPVRVVEIEAEVSSIKLPIQGEWKDTGPIKVQVASGATQFLRISKHQATRSCDSLACFCVCAPS